MFITARKLSLIMLSCVLLTLSTAAKSAVLQLNDIDWPPYFFPGKQLQPGIGKVVLTHCIRQLGYSFRYNNLPIKRTHYYMQTGELDITVYSYQKAREDAVIFGKEPLFISSYGFAARADSAIQINTLEDLTSLRFGHLAGLAHTPELNQKLEQLKLKQQVIESYDLNTTLHQLVSIPSGIDITANSRETLQWRIKSLGLADKISVLDYILTDKAYYVAVSKHSTSIKDPQQFISQIDACIVELKQNGFYQHIAEQYGVKLL